LNENNPEKVVFLCIKAFIPIDQNIKSKIDPFEAENAILLKEKFVPFENHYIIRSYSNTDILIFLRMNKTS